MAQQEEQNQQFNIQLPEEVALGKYSNMALVAHGQGEFVIDFIGILPGAQAGQVHSRIIMTPENLKRLARVMMQNVQAYEQQIAPIVLPEDAQAAGGNDFGQGQA